MGIGWMFCFYPPKFPLNCVSNFLEGVNDKNIPYMLALWVESVSIGIGNTGPAFTWHWVSIQICSITQSEYSYFYTIRPFSQKKNDGLVPWSLLVSHSSEVVTQCMKPTLPNRSQPLVIHLCFHCCDKLKAGSKRALQGHKRLHYSHHILPACIKYATVHLAHH